MTVAAHDDVAGRMAEGVPAVETVATWVAACAAQGFEHPDLTAHPGQAQDWYGTEAGMDLAALDADCARLQAAAAAAEQARDLQAGQLAALMVTWTGPGAWSAQEFLRCHGDASADASASMRSAAQALARLRDGLWQAVDTKVTAAEAIAERPQAEGAQWRAAADTVLTGVGDRATASELIDLRVTPFVAADIGSDWVRAMRTGTEATAACYAGAIAALAAEPVPVFEVPADWGPAEEGVPSTTPASAAPGDAAASGAAGPAWSTPASGGGSWAPAAAEPVPAAAEPAAAVQPAAEPAPPVEPAVAPGSSMPAIGGTPDAGSGLSRGGEQFADLLEGLLGSSGDAAGGLDEPFGVDDAADTDGESDDEQVAGEKDDEETKYGAGAVAPSGGGGTPADTEPAGPVKDSGEPETPPAEPATIVDPPPPTPPPPAEPLDVADPPAPPATPCEIAAEELPQAGQ